MIGLAELDATAATRLHDAEVLRLAGRYDSAVYLCGYAVELKLKAAVCRILSWTEFPSSSREFEHLRSLRTHNLALLLHLTGREQQVLSAHLAEWKEVLRWNTEIRYSAPGRFTRVEADAMLQAAGALLRIL